MKKISFFLCLLLSIGVMRGADVPLTLEGSGTEASPYLIKTADDLMQLAANCNAGTTATTASHYAGKYFRQTADIDMSGVENFYGIASAPLAQATATTKWSFQGIYDGAGFRIKNMKIKGLVYKDDGTVNTSTSANGSRRYVGLFGVLGTNAVIKNVIIDASCNVTAYSHTGGVAGYMNTGTKVENCVNYGVVAGYDDAIGGVVGYMGSSGEISGCANYGEVISQDDKAGGIVGEALASSTKRSSISYCFNAGAVNGCGTYAGGISGRANYTNVLNSANVGTIKAYRFSNVNSAFSQTKAGGIVGDASYSTISDCYNAGDVYASKELAGGIAGTGSQSSSFGGGLKNCLNVGYVYSAQEYLSGAVFGKSGSTSSRLIPQNCYYDAQMQNTLFGASGLEQDTIAEVKGLTTAQLTSGQSLAGFTDWVYKAGSYPVPANLNYPELTASAVTYLIFPAGQNANILTGTATANTSVGVTMQANEVPGSGNLFSVANNAITAHPTAGDGVAVFELTNGTFKRHMVVSTYTIPFSGQGTETSPYLISTPSDLQHFADLTNNMRLHWEGKHFRMTSDLDCSNLSGFNGIGCHSDTVNNFAPSYRLHFSGVFDGQNHVIRNLTINHILRDSEGNFLDWRKGTIYSGGFFGTLDNAVIRNLVIDSSCKYSTYMYSGGISSMTRNNRSRIENCHVAAGITAYNRYCGGILGEDNTDAPVDIVNCSFSGKLLSNYDYVGGIIGFNQHAESHITGCVNAGMIDVVNFDTKTASSTSQVNRIAGIAGSLRGEMSGCASYGPISFTTLETGKSQIKGMGGLTGQISTVGNKVSMHNNFTSSQVYVKGTYTLKQVGTIAGDYYRGTKDSVAVIKANYADTALCAVTELIDTATTNAVMPTTGIYGRNTASYTSGVAIDSLAQYFTFENGYYPMPKALAARSEVRAAAATFMKLTVEDGGNILFLKPGAICLFNDVMPLTGTLAKGEVFYIKDNALRMHRYNDSTTDMLTLTNGNYSTFYPLCKLIGMGVDAIDGGAEEIISTEYYTPDGIRVASPAPGTMVIAVSKTASGKIIVTKQVKF